MPRSVGVPAATANTKLVPAADEAVGLLAADPTAGRAAVGSTADHPAGESDSGGAAGESETAPGFEATGWE